MKKNLALAGIVAASLASAASAQVNVDLELSLLVDVSGSIDANEFNLQRQGYVQAFSNPNFFSTNIGAGNSIAVNFIEWSGGAQQAQVVPWTVIASQADADAFAAAINAAPRAFQGNTAPGSAINFATPLFASNNINSARQIIDVSGDGAENEGANTAAARDAALAAGIDQINGLAIGDAALTAWYNGNVRGGAESFVIQAADFAAFAGAIDRKISLEIQGVPLPTAAGMGMLGMGVLALRRRRAN